MTREKKIADKDRKTPKGCCPKCGYFLIIHSPIDKCARCDYSAEKKVTKLDMEIAFDTPTASQICIGNRIYNI